MTKTVTAEEAQAHFLELLDDIVERNVEVLVTRDGEPVAKIVPIRIARRTLEDLRGSAKILGDIVAPLDEKWDANE